MTQTVKFCPECGTRSGGTDRYCGGCGISLAIPFSPPSRTSLPDADHRSRGSRSAAKAALLLGGWWMLANRGKVRGLPALLAVLGSAACIPFAVFTALWFVGFVFFNRHNSVMNEVEVSVQGWVAAAMLSLVTAVPLSKKARSSVDADDDERQERLKRLGIALHGAVIVVAVALLLADESLNQAILRSKEGRLDHASGLSPRVGDEEVFRGLDKQFPNGIPERAGVQSETGPK